MDEIQVTFRSGDLTLEGLLANPGGGRARGRRMSSASDVRRLDVQQRRRCDPRGLVAIWDTRPCASTFAASGGSDGEYDGGPGEVDDAVAAMAFLLAQPGVRKSGAVMAGYSFGAMVAVSAGYERAEIARIVAVALPLRDGRCANSGWRIEAGAAGVGRQRFVLAGRGAASAQGENRRLGATRDRRGHRSFLWRPRSGAVASDCRRARGLVSGRGRGSRAYHLRDRVERIVGMRLGDRNYLRDGRAQVAVIHPL